ncbi:glucose 1-dehydrogenase [candidate division KSB3 bacterium]|uniref:Glucose 1-dehydrogenase n=1 Tax=candidate division KSB3 bacterium TaxID=2044937 RepID=A0A9D5Q649_9BACT|nr:glucose 1-dehydrogenase [candidate division KSB3 bacterium]MBD3325484.1 glucose 1-dehydrogenase [candidate division KSB3 bacterium]
MMRKRFEGKVALITGAAQGMGRQVALDMAAEGASIVVSDIAEAELHTLRQEIETAGGECLAIHCDMAVRQQIEAMVQKAVETYGRVDILINNAGLLVPGTIEETTDDLIDKTLDINVKGVLYAIRAVTPIMKAQHYGRIVNVASITGKRGDNSTVFVYGASKGAVISLTRSTARQLGPFGITCNAIAPHAVMTTMMKYWDDAKKQRMAESIPVKRLGTVHDMSYLMMFLASDEASFITGETININGGYYMD